MKKKTLVLLDFDGTITYEDSANTFFKSLYKKKIFFYYYHYVLCFKLIILYKLKVINYIPLKQKRLLLHTSKYDNESLFFLAEKFRKSMFHKILIPSALNKIQWHKSLGHEIWLVSASYDFILGKWAQENQLNLITNKTAYFNKKRKMSNRDINFEEKLIQINQSVNLNDYVEIYAYGDSEGDKRMLEIATKSFYKYFD